MPGDEDTLLSAARSYLARGYRPVPVPAGSKAPVLPGWQRLTLDADSLPAHFNGTGNIGLILGEPSGRLVDVDLDCPEARELAAEYLPPTGARTGRPSAPASHWWYIAPGARTKRHSDPVDRSAIVELRSTGAQTLVGPSVHPGGELYDSLVGEPSAVDPARLAACVAALAEAVVRARHGEVAPTAERPPPSGPRAGRPAGEDAERRAASYLDAMPPAVSGQGGHNRTYAAATALVHGFGLDEPTALNLLLDRYNPRCEPPWSEKELRHKVAEAATKPHDRPFGWLRDSIASNPDVDLSQLTLTESGSSVGSAGCRSRQGSDRPPDPGPIPDRLLRAPGLIGEVIDYNLATATRPQPTLALAAAVCLQAVLAARKVRDERGNRTNLYCVGVAPSGAGKDHARKVNKKILFASGLVGHEGNEDLASDAGLVTAVEAEPASLFQIDEFGRFLRTIGDPKKAPHLYNVLTALMKLYSSADTVFRGKAYADKKRNKVIDQPCVSVYGTTVPEHFFESLTADSLADGFVARLFVFESPPGVPPRRRSPAAPVPEPIVDAARWWGAFAPGGNLRSEHPEPLVVATTPEGGAVFDRLAAMVDERLGDETDAGRALWARAEEKACRLALVHACSACCESPVIDAAAAGWACELSEHLTRRMLYVCHEWVAEGQFDARQKRVLRIVRGADGKISRSDLCRKTQWLTQRERQEVIDNLLETGQLHQGAEVTATKPRVVYALA
ncbi:MAG: bifunctional DNA primase/polymerase [Phycisphaeraceae bacterium]|nr:bifunctional DNA primase/polymerase [Phycisphaeraceae bacterium]MCB9848774.1 bifunctional DNA primase/polymerase [Phycisphaeraceae bacterium]